RGRRSLKKLRTPSIPHRHVATERRGGVRNAAKIRVKEAKIPALPLMYVVIGDHVTPPFTPEKIGMVREGPRIGANHRCNVEEPETCENWPPFTSLGLANNHILLQV